VVHLLRLGDVLMIEPVLKALKEEYPNDQLHLLVNKQFSQIKDVLGNTVDEVLFFDRARVQNALGEAQAPSLEAYDIVKQTVRRLNEEKYDEVINLSQNRLSGRLVELIECNVKFGLQLNNDNQAKFNSPWFNYLEDHVAGQAKSLFHYVDVMAGGSGVTNSVTTSSNSAVAKDAYLCVQTCSSETKKTLSQKQWIDVLQKTANATGLRLVLFAGPSEQAIVGEIVDALNKNHVKAEMLSANLTDTLESIANSSGLLTVDTSIKHLAAKTSVPIVELAMGSSAPEFTGVYRDNALIISSKESCAPCPHSKPCSQSSQLCANGFESNVISSLVNHWLKGDVAKVKLIASNVRFQLKVEQTKLGDLGFWTTVELGREFSIDDLESLIEKSAWAAFLERSHLDPVGLCGSYAYKIIYFLEHHLPESKQSTVSQRLQKFERTLVNESQTLTALLARLFTAVRSVNKHGELQDFIAELSQFLITERWSRPLKEAARNCLEALNKGQEPNFSIIRKIQIELNDYNIRNRTKLKIAQMIRSNERMQNEQVKGT
jgi:ADP-heptose:LPS heptosyltransferase